MTVSGTVLGDHNWNSNIWRRINVIKTTVHAELTVITPPIDKLLFAVFTEPFEDLGDGLEENIHGRLLDFSNLLESLFGYLEFNDGRHLCEAGGGDAGSGTSTICSRGGIRCS